MFISHMRTGRGVLPGALAIALVASVSLPGLARGQSAIEQLEDMTGSTLDFGTATSQPLPQDHPMPGFHPIPGQNNNAQQQAYAAEEHAQALAAKADLAMRQHNYRLAEELLTQAHSLWPDNTNIANALGVIQDIMAHRRADRQLVSELSQAQSAMQAVEQLPITLPGLSFDKLAAASAKGDNYPYKNDSSVVDLRFLGAAPGVIDLARLQGISLRPTASDLSGARALDQAAAPQEKELSELLAGVMLASTGNSGASDQRLHNPLDDPLEAYGEKVRQQLLQHAVSVAYVSSSDHSLAGLSTLQFHLDTDPAVAHKVLLIEQNLLNNEAAVRSDSLFLAKTVISEDMAANHLDGSGFEGKYQADPAFRQQVDGQLQAIRSSADSQTTRLQTGALVQARIVAQQWVGQWDHRTPQR